MKTLYLFRHGAYEREKGDDNYGCLNQRGIQQLTQAGEKIKQELFGIEEILLYHSPRVRAEQSAEVLAETLSPINTCLESREELTCDSHRIKELVDEIINDDSLNITILVSHAPDLGRYFQRNFDQKPRLMTGSYQKLVLNQENELEIVD